MCPKPYVDDFAVTMVNMYPLYKQGVLAISGGVLDQPNVYIEAMALVANVFTEYEIARNAHGR